jgi:hypothetical protein
MKQPHSPVCLSDFRCARFLLYVLSFSEDVFQQESRVFDSERRCSRLYNEYSEVHR